MGNYRKKPVVIEAVRVAQPSPARPVGNFGEIEAFCPAVHVHPDGFTIPTLEGDMLARFGDWIIRGVKGEFYPCRADIFAATYEPASASPPPADEGAAREALREVEWSYRGVGGDGTEPSSCPACYRTRAEGHHATCVVGLALASPAPRDEAREALRELADSLSDDHHAHLLSERSLRALAAAHALSSPASDKEENRNDR